MITPGYIDDSCCTEKTIIKCILHDVLVSIAFQGNVNNNIDSKYVTDNYKDTSQIITT